MARGNRYKRQWFVVTIATSYPSYYLVSARSKKSVVKWFLHQGKHGQIQGANTTHLTHALRGMATSIGRSLQSPPNSWLMRVGTEIIMMVILD